MVNYKNVILEKFYDLLFLNLEEVVNEYLNFVDCLRFYVIDVFLKIYNVI